MGVVEDVRKLLQDLITPDLKKLEAEVKALAQRMDERFLRLDERFTAAENLAAERHNQILIEIRRTQDVANLWTAVRAIQERLDAKTQ